MVGRNYIKKVARIAGLFIKGYHLALVSSFLNIFFDITDCPPDVKVPAIRNIMSQKRMKNGIAGVSAAPGALPLPHLKE